MNNYINSELQIIGTTVIALLQWAKRSFISQTQMQSRSAASITKYSNHLALALFYFVASTQISSSDESMAIAAEGEIVVTLLGTGTPVPNRRQHGASVLVEAGGERLLFDCGRGCASQMWIVNHDHLKKTRHLFLTHMHSDHTIGIGDLFMNGWNLGRSDGESSCLR